MPPDIFALLAREHKTEDLARSVAQVDAVSSQVADFLRRLAPSVQGAALELLLREITERMARFQAVAAILPEKLTPEELVWARETFDPQECIAGIREVQRTGGSELKDFLHEL